MNRDQLDSAIDAVAKRLTQVEDDPQLASRIVGSLPERVTWRGWLAHSWAPRLAMIALAVGAASVWSSRGRPQTAVLEPLASTQLLVSPIALMSAARELEPEPIGTRPLEPVEPLEPLEPSQDFDRSLPAIAEIRALELGSLAPADLPEDGFLDVKPLAIESLPLADGSVSPHRQEW
jgi:hypothetical protein